MKKDAVYSKVVSEHKKKREIKETMKVEEKKQVMAGVDQMQKNIQRNINYDIKKARGIYKKKKKEDRNPRVKRRIKYQKALGKRRAMGVIEAYKGPQGLYSGESSGISSILNRSSKF